MSISQSSLPKTYDRGSRNALDLSCNGQKNAWRHNWCCHLGESNPNTACGRGSYCLYSFINSGYFSSSPLLLRGTPNYSIDTVTEFKKAKALQATVSEGLVPNDRLRRLEWDLNLRRSGRKALNLPLSHHTPQLWLFGHTWTRISTQWTKLLF